MSLLAEPKRRNVIRMAGRYPVASWLSVKVAGTVLPVFSAPEWLQHTIVVMLATGFVTARGQSENNQLRVTLPQ